MNFSVLTHNILFLKLLSKQYKFAMGNVSLLIMQLYLNSSKDLLSTLYAKFFLNHRWKGHWGYNQHPQRYTDFSKALNAYLKKKNHPGNFDCGCLSFCSVCDMRGWWYADFLLLDRSVTLYQMPGNTTCSQNSEQLSQKIKTPSL